MVATKKAVAKKVTKKTSATLTRKEIVDIDFDSMQEGKPSEVADQIKLIKQARVTVIVIKS